MHIHAAESLKSTDGVFLANCEVSRFNIGYDKRPFLSARSTMSQYKATEHVPGKFKREILAEAREVRLSVPADHHYQVSQEYLALLRKIRSERPVCVGFSEKSLLSARDTIRETSSRAYVLNTARYELIKRLSQMYLYRSA